MIHLDTHVALWIYSEQLDRLPTSLQAALETEPLAISPVVQIEIAVLGEIGRVTDPAEEVVSALRTVRIVLDPTPFELVARTASTMPFTRDPFDRIIAAQAVAAGARLATKDRRLRDQLPEAIWDDA